MYKKEWAVLIIATILIIPLFYNHNIDPNSLANNINAANRNLVNQNYSDSYDINIIHSNNSVGKYKIYKTASTPVDLESAKTYAGLFGLSVFLENEANYLFENATKSLTILKDGSKLVYMNKSNKNSSGKKINEQQAKTISEAFIKDKMLSLDYGICEVTYAKSSSSYKIKFINTIEGIKNYAYPKTVEIDEYGNVNYFVYYNYVYKALGQTSVISKSKAVDILLSTEPYKLNGKIDIKYQELVYNTNPNGDIYPYYLFKGQTSNNQGYECFIPSF